MRTITFLFAMMLVVGWTLPAAAAPGQPAVQQVSMQQEPQQEPQEEPSQQPAQPDRAELDVKVETSDSTVWYVNPFWIAVMVIGGLLVIAIIVAASRGGGGGNTTVIKD